MWKLHDSEGTEPINNAGNVNQNKCSHFKGQKTRKEDLHLNAVTLGISGKPFSFAAFYLVMNMHNYFYYVP